jgi:S-DNA-T family DNA segregation ATPase FtsK/SpoIIIE
MVAAAPARRLASPTIRALLVRRLAEFGGLALALGAVALLVALASYDPLDPSLNTATTRAATNLAGPPGAIAADLLLQAFGAAAVLPSLAALAWAWRIASHRGLGSFAARLASTLAVLPVVAALFAAIPWPNAIMQWPTYAGPGGALGRVLAQGALNWGHTLLGPFGGGVAWLLGFLLAAGLGWVGLGLSVRDWQAVGRTARSSVQQGRRTAGLLSRLTAPFAWLSRRLRPAEQPELAPSRSGRSHASEAEFAAAARHDDDPESLYTESPYAEPEQESRFMKVKVAVTPRISAAKPQAVAQTPQAAIAAPVVQRLAKINAGIRKPAPPPRQESLSLPEAAGGWRTPPLSLLVAPPPRASVGPSEDALQANARLLEQVLNEYGVQGVIREIRPGPVVTLYELEPAPGIRSARVIGLADDVARSLSVTAVRIATVPGRNVIGIEVPNAKRETVFLSELIGGEAWDKHPAKLALALGKDISGEPIVADLARMPHLLVAGTTGSGKSVGINAMILSLLYRLSPDQCRLILIDPKMLELSVYDGIPHLMAPVVTEPAKAVTALKWTVREMERRYRAMSQLGVRNVGGYNERVAEARARGEIVTRRVQTGFDSETGKPTFEEQPLALDALPLLVVVIDEMADLMMVAGKEIEATVQRLAQMARAAGIHVVMATQRPSVDVITGTIKANFPTRISFTVISKFDSRTILGEQGAEQLLGQGDMLYMQGGGRIGRVHGPFVTDREVEDVVAFLREQGEPAYLEEVTEQQDEEGPALSGIAGASDGEKGLFDQAVDIVAREGKASTSFIQRHLSIGYNRAAKLIEQMEKEGIVSAANHVGKREVLVRRTNED